MYTAVLGDNVSALEESIPNTESRACTWMVEYQFDAVSPINSRNAL